MMQLFELSPEQAIIIAFAFPVILVSVFILLIPWFRMSTNSKLRRYLSYAVHSPEIGTLDMNSAKNLKQGPSKLWREIKVRLFLIYTGLFIFLISFMISEFYEVIFDIMLPVNQGSTGEIRTLSSVVFQNLFSAGWVGSMPWYGGYPLPSGLGTYHETWKWVFYTAAFTDNPYFLQTIILALLLVSIVVGFAFLTPLGIKSIRQSFTPSLFIYVLGMLISTKAIIGCLAQISSLVFGGAEIRYGVMTITGDMIPNIIDGVLFGFPIALGFFAFFLAIGWKLWKIHYSDKQSRKWFMGYVTLIYWMGLIIPMIIGF
ncbi:MAG: hypothetical protein ACFFCP_09000 [Promethearchaeota archaeon]